MSLQARLTADLKEALRGGDDRRKVTIRAVLAAAREGQLEKRETLVREKRKALGLTAGDEASLDDATLAAIEAETTLTDTDYLAAVRREAKARREALADADRAGRADLAPSLHAELALLEAYLPQQLSRQAIAERAQAAIAALGVSGPKAQGDVMKRLMPELQGQADGKLVAAVVRELLAQ
jgi:uncharacterized protein YqeY